MPPLDPAIDAAVDAHWRAATARHSLFNGRVFCADTIAANAVTGIIAGHWTEYRRVVAQMREPALFSILQVRSLAVCGVLCCAEGIVVGRREAAAFYQPGQWQLPPAGSVDDSAASSEGADWQRALLAELQEELGLAPNAANALRPLCLVQHPTGVLDMGIRIDTSLPAPEILERHRAAGNGEYDRLLILPNNRLVAALQVEGGRLVPASACFLGHLGD